MILTATLLLGPTAGSSDALTKKQMRDEMRAFDLFLRNRPKMANELQTKPALAGNRKYLDKNQDLKNFFKQHPVVQHEIINHPREVFASVGRR